MATVQTRAEQSSGAKTQATRPRVVTWLMRILAALLILVAALVVCGLIYQVIGESNDARAFPPPGQMVSVNGLNLHLYCTGTGSPVVILESMAGNNSTEWGWIQPEIAASTRVCSYDRAGAGWSDSPAAARTAQETVRDLHTLLQSANVSPPFVFVGHSIGGIFSRMYAAQFPDEVVGMVLVDSSHPEQMKRYPKMRTEMDKYMQEAAVYPWLARLGLFRLFFASGEELDFAQLAPKQRAELKAMWSAAKYHEHGALGITASLALYDNPPAPGTLGDMPLIVLTATEHQTDSWMDLQKELAALSTHAEHRMVQGASHASLAFNPEHAHTVAQAIQDVLAGIRAR